MKIAAVAACIAAVGALGCGATKARTVTATTTQARNGGSPEMLCTNVGQEVPAANVKVSGSATCATAEVVLARCGRGGCDGQHIEVQEARFLCLSNHRRPLAREGCTGPGEIVAWTYVPKP
jgi:hypothetical protein